METGIFCCGPLLHDPLRTLVIGRAVAGRPARLAGHGLRASGRATAPWIAAEPGAEIDGILLEGLSAAETARLDFYLACFGSAPERVAVWTSAGPEPARVHLPAKPAPGGRAWSLADWAERWGPIATAAAAEVMALQGARVPAEIGARYWQILVRAASRTRTRAAPVSVRRRAEPGDVELCDWRQPYARFFALEEYAIRFRRFDGTMSEVVSREVFISGDAATVLPYDAARDRVLLIEQFRPGPHARGDAQPWLLEPIAGRVDPGETPEDTVRREALEEAGVTLGRLLPIGSYYPTPAGKSEYLYSFIGLADLPDGWRAGASGMADEHEDIRAHVMAFERLMELVESGEVGNGPLLISALALARRRAGLRGAA